MALADAGARGIVLFNRWYEADVDLETLTFRTSLRLSTAEEIRLPLMWIALLAGKTSLSLAAGRGVEGSEEVIKYLLAGADVVQTASSLLRHGRQPSRLSGRGLGGMDRGAWRRRRSTRSGGACAPIGSPSPKRCFARSMFKLARDFPVLLHVASHDTFRARAS